MSGRGDGPRAADRRWKRDFVSEVFHTISQPLTAVQVSLELALKKKRPDEQQSAIRDSLAITARAIEKARFVRLLAEAGDPGDVAEVDLQRVLSGLVDEMAPVAQAQGSKMTLRGDVPTWVRADEARLRQALFLLTDVALRGCSKLEMQVCLQASKRFARVTFGTGGCQFVARKRRMALVSSEEEERAVLLSRAMIGAIRGDVEHWQDHSNECWVVSIPRYCEKANATRENNTDRSAP